jgi:hypothetical protein
MTKTGVRKLPDVSKALIERYSSPESFRRGQGYYRQGAVASLPLRGQELRAKVAGSQFAPYSVRVIFDEAGIIDATGSCPYEWGGPCKHIVAALLAYAHEPESVRELPELEEALSGLGKEESKDLVLKLAERYPYLGEAIEGEIALSSSSGLRQINVDAIRRSLRANIQAQGYPEPYYDYWHPAGDLDEARRILEGAWSLIRADDAPGALRVLEAITEEYLESPDALDLEMMGDFGGELLDFFEEVGSALTEALLSVELTPDEREDYAAKLDVWLGEFGEYAVGDTFGAAYRAVEQGWSYPSLVRVLEGDIPDDEFFDELSDLPLTIARLNVLDRRGRHEEYLRLSAAAGEDTRHAIMLARIDRSEEAIEYASKHLSKPEEGLTVAEALLSSGVMLKPRLWSESVGSRWKAGRSGWRAGSVTSRRVLDAEKSPSKRPLPPSTQTRASPPTCGYGILAERPGRSIAGGCWITFARAPHTCQRAKSTFSCTRTSSVTPSAGSKGILLEVWSSGWRTQPSRRTPTGLSRPAGGKLRRS